MKVALVYDRVNKIGGAEKVLLALNKIWPEAPLFCAVYDPKKALWAKKFKKIIPSFLQKIPFAKKIHEFFPWLTPLAFEAFNFQDYDVVISVTSAEAKSIMTQPTQLHLCYCLTPTRYLWSGFYDYQKNPGFGFLNPIARFIFFILAPGLRIFDQVVSQRVDKFLAISYTVKERIKKYYKRESEVIYPPVDINKFKISKKTKANYFLVVSRLVPYKNIDLIVKAFNDLGWPLKIIGVGNQLAYLQKIAKKNVEFLGQVKDDEIKTYYQNCQALVMATEEDFGITALEAQACGKPVIAYKKGGATETIKENETGIFFEKLKVDDLKLALIKFKRLKFKALACRQNAQKFAQRIFLKQFKNLVEEEWQKKIKPK